MILDLRGFGELSVFEVALIFTILGAFLVFFGLYVMLRKHKADSRKKRFVKKQLTMEQALSERLKQRKYKRNLWKALGKREDIDPDEKYTEEVQANKVETGKERAVFLSEIKKAQIEGKNWEPARKYKNTAREEMIQENRKISHRREQLKRLEEGTVLK